MRWGTIVRVKGGLAERIVSLGGEWDDSLYVIGSPDGSFKNPETLGKGWSMLVKLEGWKGTQGLPVRFHDLRHTYAVNSLKAGDDIKTVQENLGHATASFALSTYAHATPGMKRESANRIEQLY